MSAPIEVRCPECQATLKLKNTDAVGRRVPCPKCSQPFVIELPADDGLEVLDDFDDFGELDEFDEAGDYGDIDEVSAKPKPAAKKKSSGKKVWIIVGSVLGVGILCVGGYFGALAMGWLGGGDAMVAQRPNVEAPPAEAVEVAKPPPAEVGPSEFDTHWLPPDAQVVASINLGRIWDGSLAQQSLNDPTLGPQLKATLDEMKKETILGLDEISKITVGVSGVSDVLKVALSAPSGQLDKGAIERATMEKLIPTVVLHLREAVTPAQLSVMGQKMKTTTLEGKTVFVFREEPGEPRVLAYQVDEKTVVFSVERFIKQLIATGDPYTPRPDLAFVDGSQDFVVAVTLPEPLTIPLPPGDSESFAQMPGMQSLLDLNGKLKGLGFGLKMLDGGKMSLSLQGLSSDETGSKLGKVALEEALKMGQQLLVPLKQNTFIAEQIKPLEDGLNGSKVTQTGPEFGFLASFKMPQDQNFLAGMLLPMIQQSRDAAEAMKCQNNLKQIGVAMHNYSATLKSFPAAAITSKDGKPLLSWRVSILPYIEQEVLYDKFKLDEPWDSPTNKALIPLIPETYVCPSGKLENGMTSYRLITSGKSAYKDGKPLSDSALAILVRSSEAGHGDVPLVVDAGDEHAVAWTAPETFDSADGIRSHHQGGVNVLFANGHVSSQLDPAKLLAAAPDPDDDGSKDQSKFQGTWLVTAASVAGSSLPAMVGQEFTFQGNSLQQLVKAGQQPLQSTFQINFRTNPRTFDWVQSGNKRLLGLYRFRGQMLKLTVATPGQSRPRSLSDSGGVLQLSLKRKGGAGTVQRPNSAGSVAATKGAKKNAGPPVNSPGANLQGSAKTLFQVVANRELVATNPKGERVSIQLNPDGTTRDHLGNESPSYSIKNLSVSWEIDGLINTLKFRTSTPKVGDTCTFQQKKKSDGSTVVGSYQQLKVVEINPAKPKRKPASAIDGTWKIVSAVVSGKPSELLKGRMLSFAEGKAALNVTKLDAIGYQFTYKADIEAKPAKFRVFLGEKQLMTGIYRYQGNRLQLCFVRGEKTTPPMDFTAKGIGHQLYVMEPVKTP
jgi:uncharacterized protein (TIGR03067 family)